MKVIIRRSAGLFEYEVPRQELNEDLTVMQLLDYIAEKLEPDLAYYKHSVCNHGICAGCVIKVDGRNCLACVQKVPLKAELIRLEPCNDKVIRDLVVQP